MRGHVTESSLFGQLANTLWNERCFAVTAPNTSQNQQPGCKSVFGTDLFSELRWPFSVKLNTISFQRGEAPAGKTAPRAHVHKRRRTRSPYTFTQWRTQAASSRTCASGDEAAAEPWNIFIHPCSHGNKWNCIPVTTLFWSQKQNHLLKTYSHVEKFCVDCGEDGRRRYGPWPMFPFQAWNSHILPHWGWRWGGMMPWLLTLLYA